jgi:hypothetical protein
MCKPFLPFLIAVSLLEPLSAGKAIYNAIQNSDTTALIAALRHGEPITCSGFF